MHGGGDIDADAQGLSGHGWALSSLLSRWTICTVEVGKFFKPVRRNVGKQVHLLQRFHREPFKDDAEIAFLTVEGFRLLAQRRIGGQVHQEIETDFVKRRGP